MTTEYAGFEAMPDEPFTPRMYKIRFRCNRCNHEYHKVSKTANIPDMPCPKSACKAAIHKEEVQREALKLAKMLEEQRPPAQIGANISVKAVDKTAEVVMHDYKMTDLKDNIRQGEAMAPKLAPHLQKRADDFFTGPGASEGGNRRARHLKALGQRAIAGAFAKRAVDTKAILGGQRGESSLWSVREEKIRGR
jgi:hypothetical protein